MTVTIKKKSAEKIKIPANKGEEFIELEKNQIAYEIPGKNIYVLKPKVDWLELRVNIPPKHQADIKGNIATSCKKSSDDYKLVKSLYPKKNSPYAGYLLNAWWRWKDDDEAVLIQCVPKMFYPNQKSVFVKLKMNPTKLGIAGMNAFKAAWAQDIDKKGCCSINDLFSRPKAICRIDVAIDILGLDTNQITSGKASLKDGGIAYGSSKSTTYANETGRKQSHYPFLKKDMAASQTYYYNKTAEMKDKVKASPYGSVPVTRYERRIIDPTTSVLKLSSLQNQAKKLMMKAFDFKTLEGSQDHALSLYCQLALHRTPEKALKYVPKTLHAAYKKTFKDGLIDFWKPLEIWQHWPSSLWCAGLFSPVIVTKKKTKKK